MQVGKDSRSVFVLHALPSLQPCEVPGKAGRVPACPLAKVPLEDAYLLYACPR